MKKILVFIIMFSVISALKAQPYSQWSNQELAKANTAQNTNLSEQEKLVFFYCNLARLNGEKFKQTYAAKKLTGNSSYVTSLKRDLSQTKDLPMLYPEKNLCETAKYHAVDMGTHNMTGHNSSDGTSFSQRLKKYYSSSFCGENCSYGYSDALDIVMQLLIDEGVTSLGHRTNILNPKYNAMGTSIQPHKYYSYNCVQDFGDKIITPLGSTTPTVETTETTETPKRKVREVQREIVEMPVSQTNSKKVLEALNYLNAIRNNPQKYVTELNISLKGIKATHALTANSVLMNVAQQKADDMAKRNYFNYLSPEGYGMNYYISHSGYTLNPEWTEDKSLTYFTSICAQTAEARDVINELIIDNGAYDPGNRKMLLGISKFYASCYDIGIGYAYSSSSKYGHYWCIIIAKHDF